MHDALPLPQGRVRELSPDMRRRGRQCAGAAVLAAREGALPQPTGEGTRAAQTYRHAEEGDVIIINQFIYGQTGDRGVGNQHLCSSGVT